MRLLNSIGSKNSLFLDFSILQALYCLEVLICKISENDQFVLKFDPKAKFSWDKIESEYLVKQLVGRLPELVQLQSEREEEGLPVSRYGLSYIDAGHLV